MRRRPRRRAARISSVTGERTAEGRAGAHGDAVQVLPPRIIIIIIVIVTSSLRAVPVRAPDFHTRAYNVALKALAACPSLVARDEIINNYSWMRQLHASGCYANHCETSAPRSLNFSLRQTCRTVYVTRDTFLRGDRRIVPDHAIQFSLHQPARPAISSPARRSRLPTGDASGREHESTICGKFGFNGSS